SPCYFLSVMSAPPVALIISVYAVTFRSFADTVTGFARRAGRYPLAASSEWSTDGKPRALRNQSGRCATARATISSRLSRPPWTLTPGDVLAERAFFALATAR